MQCIMDVELNIMQKRSVSTKGKAEQSGGAAAQTVTLLRNTSNRDNVGISDYCHGEVLRKSYHTSC